LSVVKWPSPDWTVVPEAEADQDFYECIALSGVARFNPGPNRATVKEISILFDYKQEHTILYKRWLGDMDMELIPTEPRTVTSSLGRSVETSQIAIIPLQPIKKGGEPVVIGAWVVEESTWSKGTALTIKNLRERFVSRPTISKAQTARKPRMIDLVVGRDSPKIFPELAQEARHKGDDFVQPGAGYLWLRPEEHSLGRQPRQPGGRLEAAVQESGQRKEKGQEHGEAG
jgi:hypothetical protein